MSKFSYWMWGVAERLQWSRIPPRSLWNKLLRHYDRKAGYLK